MPLLTDHGWPWLTMVNHCQLVMVNSWSMMVEFVFWPWSTMVKPWSVMVFTGSLTMNWPSFDHGHYIVMVVNATTDWPCLTMVDHGQLVMVNSWSMIVNPASTMVDHGQPWSFRGLSTMKWPSFDHGHYMVDDGHGTTDWPWSIYRIWLPLTIIWPWLLTMVDHGQPWSFRGLSTLKWPSFDHGHYMVDDSHGTTDWPWSTMVDHGQYIGFDYHWPSYDHDYWPWSTMVMTILQTWSTMVRPWSIDGHLMVDHGQWPWSTMVKPWSTMVWPWSCCKGGLL